MTFFAGTTVLTDEVRVPALDQPGVLCGYTTLVLAAGGWLLTRRDA